MRKMIFICSVLALMMSSSASAQTQMPSELQFNLNLIGVPKGKTAKNMGSGNRIFVPLSGATQINMRNGPTFKVLDGNGTDGSALFQLPPADNDLDGITKYSVFARALGKPAKMSKIEICAMDTMTTDQVCDTRNTVFVRSRGNSPLVNVTNTLLYVYMDLDKDGAAERYSLFDDRLQSYFWKYDNNGMRILQLRFYADPTDVN